MAGNAHITPEIYPPCSKLFVSIGTKFTETEVRDAFEPFGRIEDVYVPMDKMKEGPRGFAFVKYSKTSEAAAAVEALDKSTLGAERNQIHVAVSGSRREDGDKDADVLPVRIIVTMPQKAEPEDVKAVFCKYGSIRDVNVTKSDPRKAVVRFDSFVDAARCYEDCPSTYSPKFLLPRKKEKNDDSTAISTFQPRPSPFGPHIMNEPMQFNNHQGGNNLPNYPGANQCHLRIVFNSGLTKDHLTKVFNIVPGLLDIKFVEMLPTGAAVGKVIYDNNQSAAHAAERINGMDYPIGSRLEVAFDPTSDPKIKSLLETIQEATNILKGSGINVSVNAEVSSNYGYGGGGDNYGMRGMGGGYDMGGGYGGGEQNMVGYNNVGNYNNPNYGLGNSNSGGGGYSNPSSAGGFNNTSSGMDRYSDRGGDGDTDPMSALVNSRCSARLPPRQDLSRADIGDVKMERLFFVIKKMADHPDADMITNLFCRFGDLFNAHLLPDKNFGYARFTSLDSAERCIEVLSGETFMRGDIKIEHAQPEKYSKDYSKKRRID